jgi:hypothetical protein
VGSETNQVSENLHEIIGWYCEHFNKDVPKETAPTSNIEDLEKWMNDNLDSQFHMDRGWVRLTCYKFQK